MGNYVIPAWLTENDRKYRPTEIFVPVMIGIGPVWDHQRDQGGWYGRMDVAFPIALLVDEPVWQCDHTHLTEDEAWACAEAFADEVVKAQLERSD